MGQFGYCHAILVPTTWWTRALIQTGHYEASNLQGVSLRICEGSPGVGIPQHSIIPAEDFGRGTIDAIFAVALTEQGRNQETW